MAVETSSVTFDSKRLGGPDLRLLHYNDVYHVDPSSQQVCGGITRFMTVCKEYRNGPVYKGKPDLLTFFSGDAWNPSIESTVSKGKHMVPVLNTIGTDVACVGNHDLDFGVPQFRYLAALCKFPWLLGNVLDPALGENEAIANCQKSLILTSSNGIKIGVVGLGEREWLDTINSLPPDLQYKSATETAEKLVPPLRAAGAEIIIAVTHMREPNDVKLARNTTPGLIDIVLGGHDHYYNHQIINQTHVLRSGTDFKQLSYIEAFRSKDKKGSWDFTILRRDIIRSIPEDPPTLELLADLTSHLKTRLEKPVGYTAVPLDGRFNTVRTRESNLGNFICDLMRYYYNADCAIMAAGTLRGDQIYPPGVLKLKAILECLPFEDPVVVLRLDGFQILKALENGVSKLPALEGRFPQVSNITFAFSGSAPPMSRISSVKIGDAPLDPNRKYVLATRGYMGRGKDGYDDLLIEELGGSAEEIVSEENGVLISTIVRQYFMSLKVLGKWRRWGPSLGRHWGQVQKAMDEAGTLRQPSQPSSPALEKKMRFKHGRNGSFKPMVAIPPKTVMVDGPGDALGGAADESSDEEMEMEMELSGTLEPERDPLEDWEKAVIRKVTRKWLRVAGLTKEIGLVGEEGEFLPHWTKGIAPCLEGRIVIS
ncbi:MAG: hypothetical protein M1814_001106 [Vezdaea aestivalis]|nr:MAG: hypothetical protein M1814_001106 [Vezdaea aestivalis]